MTDLEDTLAAESMVARLIDIGNVLVDQNDMDNGAVMAAEDEWQALVAEWQVNQKGDSNV
jgi:hypothetical protein